MFELYISVFLNIVPEERYIIKHYITLHNDLELSSMDCIDFIVSCILYQSPVHN